MLSHGTAAALWGFAPEPDTASVTLAGRNIRQPPGLKIHRVGALDIRDVRLHQGVPVTAPARALIDYAAAAGDVAVADAVNEARVQGLVDDRQLEEAMERCPGRSGVGRVKALLARERGPAITRSDMEKRLRALVEQAQLPWPQFNVRLHGFLVDALWEDARVVVEADGYLVHGGRSAFESDRRRDQVLAAAGYVVVRIAWRQLWYEPMAVLARLAQALAVGRERRAA